MDVVQAAVSPVNLDFLVTSADPPLAEVRTSSGTRSREAADLRHELSQVLADYGITRVAHLTGFDRLGIPVHMAVKPQGRSLASGSGKGLTKDASWVSAVMEACEQAVWEDLRLESWEASQQTMRANGYRTVDGAKCAQMKRSIWTDSTPVLWTSGIDIMDGLPRYVPSSLVDVSPIPARSLRPFVSGSNGLASGAHILEAMLSGLLEVIERDGLTLYSHVRQRPMSDGIPILHEVEPMLAECVMRAGVDLRIIDATSDIGVPTVVAYVYDTPGGRTGVFKGAGAGLSVGTALVRAVTEALQARCVIVAGARDDIFDSMRSAAVTRQHTAPPPTAPAPTLVDHSTGSIESDLSWLAQRLRDSSHDQIVVLRHTKPSDLVQVVRVIVPGLEGYRFSHAGFGLRAQKLAQGASS
jgi:ribosomal protein S12 methylthiotransferase accessory factor